MAFEFFKNLFLPEAKEEQVAQDNIENVFKMIAAEAAKNIKFTSDEIKEEANRSLSKDEKEDEEELIALEMVDEEEEFFVWFNIIKQHDLTYCFNCAFK